MVCYHDRTAGHSLEKSCVLKQLKKHSACDWTDHLSLSIEYCNFNRVSCSDRTDAVAATLTAGIDVCLIYIYSESIRTDK